MTEPIEVVPVDAWVARASALREAGYRFVDLLAAQDESTADQTRTRVVLRLRRDGDWAAVTVATDIAATLPSLQHVHPGVTWHEREAAELLGLTLVAADGAAIDTRPLLWVGQALPSETPSSESPSSESLSSESPSVKAPSAQAPLRRSVLLDARQSREWPGALDPGGRRRHRPIGVPDEQALGSARGSAR